MRFFEVFRIFGQKGKDHLNQAVESQRQTVSHVSGNLRPLWCVASVGDTDTFRLLNTGRFSEFSLENQERKRNHKNWNFPFFDALKNPISVDIRVTDRHIFVTNLLGGLGPNLDGLLEYIRADTQPFESSVFVGRILHSKPPELRQTCLRIHGQTDGRTDRRTDGQTDGRTDGRTDGWIGWIGWIEWIGWIG